MSQEKKNKKSVESENKSDLQPVISFDVYFQALMRERSGVILPHHKAPMRRYAADAGLLEGTKEAFDKMFKLY